MSLLKLTTHERQWNLQHSIVTLDIVLIAVVTQITFNSWSINESNKNKNYMCSKGASVHKSCKEMSLEKPNIFGSKPNIWNVKYVCRDQMPLLKAPKHTIGNRWKVSHLSVNHSNLHAKRSINCFETFCWRQYFQLSLQVHYYGATTWIHLKSSTGEHSSLSILPY